MDTSLTEIDAIVDEAVRRKLDGKGLKEVIVTLEDFGEPAPAIRVDLRYDRERFSAPELMSAITGEIRRHLLKNGDERPVLLRNHYTDDVLDDEDED